jgi:hypothetical protein
MKTYTYPRNMRASITVLSVFATGLAWLAANAMFSDRSVIEKSCAGLFVLLPFAFYWQVIKSFSTVTLADDIIRLKRPFLRAQGINIAHISKIRYRTILQCIDLTNELGDNTISIDYLVQGYPLLLDHILGRRPELCYSTGQTVFRAERSMIAFLTGIGMLGLPLGAYFLFAGQLGGAAMFLGLSLIYFIVAGLTVVHTVVVNSEGLELIYFFRKLVVPFSAIEDVSLSFEFVRTSLHHVVKIERKGQKPLELSGFEDGEIRLHHCLDAAFRSFVR